MDILDLSGATIRELRENLNWSREFLSEKSGVPARSIQDIETGVTKNPGIENIKALLRAMPSYVSPSREKTKAESILDLLAILPALNEHQLEVILNLSAGFAKDNGVTTSVRRISGL